MTKESADGQHIWFSDCDIETAGDEISLVRPDKQLLGIGKVVDPSPMTGLVVTATSYTLTPRPDGLKTNLKAVSYHIPRKADLRQWFKDCVFFCPVEDTGLPMAFLVEPPQIHKVTGVRYLHDLPSP